MFFVREREERNQDPRGCFYRRNAPRPHLPHRRSMGKRAIIARSPTRSKTRSAQLFRFQRPLHARINFVGEASHPARAQRHGRSDSPREC